MNARWIMNKLNKAYQTYKEDINVFTKYGIPTGTVIGMAQTIGSALFFPAKGLGELVSKGVATGMTYSVVHGGVSISCRHKLFPDISKSRAKIFAAMFAEYVISNGLSYNLLIALGANSEPFTEFFKNNLAGIGVTLGSMICFTVLHAAYEQSRRNSYRPQGPGR